MKALLFPILSGICFLPVNNKFNEAKKQMSTPVFVANDQNNNEPSEINFQDSPGFGRMSSVKFKAQEDCRVELKDFEFDAKFYVVSATVYFTGANFRDVEKGTITSSSLKPIKNLMSRCMPGTIVVFDNVKVKGPDNEIRTIQGISLTLY